MREWPYTTWSGDVYNTHCGSRFPLALAKSVVRRGCSLFNPTHSSSRQCMFVLMYEHCMYIVHTVISPHSLLPQEYCHDFNASWESRIFEIKLNIPGVWAHDIHILKKMGIFQTNWRGFPLSLLSFWLFAQEGLFVLTQDLASNFVKVCWFFSIVWHLPSQAWPHPQFPIVATSVWISFLFHSVQTWLTTQTKSNEKL